MRYTPGRVGVPNPRRLCDGFGMRRAIAVATLVFTGLAVHPATARREPPENPYPGYVSAT
jgi:hypothetical protein